MSTDIVHWQKPDPGGLEKVVSTGAVSIFLALTIPFMILTFVAAFGFYLWSKRHERKDGSTSYLDAAIRSDQKTYWSHV